MCIGCHYILSKNSIGPITVACGTPIDTTLVEDVTPL